MKYCTELGIPESFGDPCSGRVNCLVIHEGNPWGCEVNALNRFYKGFKQIFPVSIFLVITINFCILCYY